MNFQFFELLYAAKNYHLIKSKIVYYFKLVNYTIYIINILNLQHKATDDLLTAIVIVTEIAL